MTAKQFFLDNFGYELITTFWDDFSIADHFGIEAVKDTYKRAFENWKNDYKYLTELTLILNHKIWQHYEKNEPLARVYDKLWKECQDYGYTHLKGDELRYFYETLD